MPMCPRPVSFMQQRVSESLRGSQGVSGGPRRPLKARRSQLRPERLPDAGLAEWLPPDAPSRSLWGVGLVKLT